ncbi:MAG: DUF1571 domain-containing protein [Phycisphaerae bacterium]
MILALRAALPVAVLLLLPAVAWFEPDGEVPEVSAPLNERKADATTVAHVTTRIEPAAPNSAAKIAAAVPLDRDGIAALLASNPEAVVRMGAERYRREVRDYRCRFSKQELLDSGMTAVQEIDVLYREKPLSVYMTWVQNEDKAKRALFIDHPAFRDAAGERLARVEPAGAVLRLFVSDVMTPIRGPQARASSRRAIDEFGFRAIFELFERYNRMAEKDGVLKLAYGGTGSVGGRPTYIIVRQLPERNDDAFPDALLKMHLDQEWLLPTGVYSYSDLAGRKLLGSYVITNVVLNAGLTDAAFKF